MKQRPLTEADIRDWGSLFNILGKVVEGKAQSPDVTLVIVLCGALMAHRVDPNVVYLLVKEALPLQVEAALILLREEERDRKHGKPQGM